MRVVVKGGDTMFNVGYLSACDCRGVRVWVFAVLTRHSA